LINICIHGHFYQPPRENPWTGEIELQSSAEPFHDWNERIYFECYKPNTEAEILNDSNEVVARVNNFEHINFNFGPTLLNWIKIKHNDTYNKIISADKNSLIKFSGHGNAIAMCYNHIIMPLANLNDKITQVKWGLADFKYHFNRDSEGIWLPETACNQETIEVLINENIKYIILDSSQADMFRKIGSDKWLTTEEIPINSNYLYKCYSEINNEKYINIFFYNGPVSKAVAFDDVLISSQNLLNKIYEAANSNININSNTLISIATDGETFGHHKKFAERTLAFFIVSLAPENNLNIQNFGKFLSENPPEYEVKIKKGENNEGTSWSCIHGVKRWKEDCGCGGGGGWHQQWRKPLRNSLNWLRDNLIIIYQNLASEFFNDIWKARNDYIFYLLDKNENSLFKFLNKNAKYKLSKNEINLALDLLEIQRYSMFMFTSCGWFFSEISGLETVKILEYACIAIELTKKITGIDLEPEFLNKLSKAKSNIPKYKDGAGVYKMLVLPNKNIAKINTYD
jgi:alpha-amylase/alpha-mannosidase (GH57 family)